MDETMPRWDWMADQSEPGSTSKNTEFKKWLAVQWQVSQFGPYFKNTDALLDGALPWLRERGNAASVRRALGWLGYGPQPQVITLEEDGARLHIDLGRVVVPDSKFTPVAHVVRASLPLHVHFWRVYHGWDLRPIWLDAGPALDGGLLDNDSGVMVDVAPYGLPIKVSQGIWTLTQAPVPPAADVRAWQWHHRFTEIPYATVPRGWTGNWDDAAWHHMPRSWAIATYSVTAAPMHSDPLWMATQFYMASTPWKTAEPVSFGQAIHSTHTETAMPSPRGWEGAWNAMSWSPSIQMGISFIHSSHAAPQHGNPVMGVVESKFFTAAWQTEATPVSLGVAQYASSGNTPWPASFATGGNASYSSTAMPMHGEPLTMRAAAAVAAAQWKAPAPASFGQVISPAAAQTYAQAPRTWMGAWDAELWCKSVLQTNTYSISNSTATATLGAPLALCSATVSSAAQWQAIGLASLGQAQRSSAANVPWPASFVNSSNASYSSATTPMHGAPLTLRAAAAMSAAQWQASVPASFGQAISPAAAQTYAKAPRTWMGAWNAELWSKSVLQTNTYSISNSTAATALAAPFALRSAAAVSEAQWQTITPASPSQTQYASYGTNTPWPASFATGASTSHSSTQPEPGREAPAMQRSMASVSAAPWQAAVPGSSGQALRVSGANTPWLSNFASGSSASRSSTAAPTHGTPIVLLSKSGLSAAAWSASAPISSGQALRTGGTNTPWLASFATGSSASRSSTAAPQHGAPMLQSPQYSFSSTAQWSSTALASMARAAYAGAWLGPNTVPIRTWAGLWADPWRIDFPTRTYKGT